MKTIQIQSALMMLFAASTIFLPGPAFAQGDAPENLDELIQDFNDENGIETEEEDLTLDDYGLATYDKSRTQFDGVTNEMQVTYLKLNLNQGVEIPILSSGIRDQNIDFSVMMWFKVDQAFGTKSVPGGENPQIMYLFSFEDSVACFFTDTLTLICDSWDRRKLQIKANLITPGIWYHLTLSSSSNDESFLLVQDSGHKIVGQDSVQNFGFRQNTNYGWKACIGDCNADFGFLGGVREVLMLQKAVTRDEASRGKNMILTYDSSIKAYFRFQDLQNKFEKDEFVDWPWLNFKNFPTRRDVYVGVDIIPNDVCPSLFKQIETMKWSGNNKMEDYDMKEGDLAQNQYAYTMSMTLQLNETSCTTLDPSDAEKDCNLVEMEGVFMLYLMGRNTARFFFFANKNYYESASEMIYLPYDQWITIQMTLEHYNGYSIVVSDQNGNAFYRTKVAGNMHEQWPTGKLSLFRAFEGYVEHFYLTNTLEKLHPYYATNFRDSKDGLVNLLINKDDSWTGKGFENKGSLKSQFKLSGSKSFEDVFFHVPSEGGNVDGTLADTNRVFDGIACNDRHMTTHLDTEESYIHFQTPPFIEWSRENTIEFWFKVTDPAVYEQDVLLFSMISNENNPQLYYHVYIQNGDLKCAPFGTASFKDPILTFTQFSLENQDTYGWWHVSCSYNFQKTAKGTLFNTNLQQSLEETMIGLPKFYPTNSLYAAFGKQGGNAESLPGASNVLIKEFRFWNQQLTAAELSNNRYRQVDPTKLPGQVLIVYLRMATGSSLIDNFAARNQFYTFDGFDIQQKGLSFMEDFMETERYSYNKELDLVVSQKTRTYHTVCPVHTYFMKQYCYNEPVNKAVLAIFPSWNAQSSTLGWEMTLIHSSVINHEVIQFLKDSWTSTDSILNDFFEQSETSLQHQVPSTILRHESEYEITASLSNDELTFLKTSNIKFSPSKCKWLTVVDHGVSQGFDIFKVSPGTEDITFQLELKRHPDLDCSSFDFFNAFSGLDFEFLMTDTADYISYIPQMTIRAFDPVSQNEIQFGDIVPDTMLVDITMPKTEQEKLPVFQDIMMILTVHWSSSSYGTAYLTEDIVFQNLLYTVKFEPIANVLFADLVASQTDVIREETLILDASNSKISNMPEVQQRRSLAFQWECPAFLSSYCKTQGGSQLAIPFTQVKQADIVFEQTYEFSVTVIWAKPDGQAEKSTLTIEAKWFDLVMPNFSIDYDSSQMLITAKQNSLFYLQALNFNVDDIYDYDVVWAINPSLSNPDNFSVLSGGRVMQIDKGAYSKNTDYVVSLQIVHKTLLKLDQIRTIEFSTLAPPQGGNISVQPFEGFIGDEFTVILTDWSSANMPLEYNVFSTLDANGLRQGQLLNEDGPIPVSEQFKFIAKTTTPIIVAVFDASGESLEYPLKPQISLAPEPVPEEPKPEDSEGTEDETSTGDETSEDDDTNTDGEDAAVDDNQEAPVDEGARRALPSPNQLMKQIQSSKNFSQRVSYMNIAIETVQKIDEDDTQLNSISAKEQTDFRRQLLAEIEKQVIDFQSADGLNNSVVTDDPLRMSPRDFIVESFQILAQLTTSPQYLDQDIVDKCVQVIYRLKMMQNNLFDLILEAEKGSIRITYFRALENLNKYARLNNVERTLLWIRQDLEESMDKMCSFVGLPEVFSYNSNTDELGFSLFKFDQQKALLGKRGELSALDATYNYSAYTLYNWFTAMQPGELCMQVYGQQFGTVNMKGAYLGNSKARLQATVYTIGSKQRYSMGELSGQTVATFGIDRSTFASNQTVCMGYSKTDGMWRTDLCQSQLKVEEVTMKCTCNAFDSNQIGVFNDYTRDEGLPVAFPAIEIKEQQLTVVPTIMDPALAPNSASKTGKSTELSDGGLNGTNYVWMGQTFLLSILCLAGSFVTKRMDRKDEASLSVSRTSPIAAAKQNHFIEEVAKELNESYAQVSLRKQSLLYYRTIFSKSSFPHLMSQIHPLISPFTNYCATQARFTRFSIYMLQVNIVSASVYLYYSAVYRQNDSDRKLDVIDSQDILSLIVSIGVFSILLTPWLSEPLIKACSNQVVASGNPSTDNIVQPVQIKTRRQGLRVALIVLSIVSSIALPVWAIAASGSVPASNQYLMGTAVIGSLFGATLGTNLIYLWINSCLARKVAYAPTKGKAATQNCIVHYKALQIVRDMKVVNEIKEQFTLADVLPSSMECSDRESCSHHSMQANSRNISRNEINKLPMVNEKTFDDNQMVEIIDEVDHRQTHENIQLSGKSGQCMVSEPIEEQEDNRPETDQNDDSQRGLQTPQMNPFVMNMNNESHKQLLANMLNKSALDFDNSRNDVVPQRTFMDDGPYASIHPEGESKCSNSISSSSQPEGSIVSDEQQQEDNEASPINSGKQRKAPNCDLKIVLQ